MPRCQRCRAWFERDPRKTGDVYFGNYCEEHRKGATRSDDDSAPDESRTARTTATSR